MKPTKKLIVLTLIISGILFSQPKLSLDNSEVDLGSMYSGEKKKGRIVLKNIGNDTLHILSIQPTCGCTAVKQPKAFLLPDESDVVEIEFNSTSYRGRVEKHVSITTNDPTFQFISVKLIANIKEILHPISGSSFIFFNNPPIEKTTTQKVSFSNVSGELLKIEGVIVPSSEIQVVLGKEKLEPNETLEIQVSIKPVKVGYSNTQFTIETDNKHQPNVEIRVTYYIPAVNK